MAPPSVSIRPICFVASALGKEDVDQIYDRAIRPVLEELRIRPVRVDRIEHNDDIDDTILALINRSELCIADLTYARPSVYYEAGVVHGLARPVVYIARSDHFRDKDSDSFGNLRVHFDLQMKNVIAWTGANEAFRKRLRRRLKRVIRPILDKRKKDARLEQERAKFSQLPVAQQLAGLEKATFAILRRRGFRAKMTPHGERPVPTMTRIIGHRQQTVDFRVFDRLTARNIQDWWSWSFVSRSVDDSISKHLVLYVGITLKRIADSTLRSALPRFTPVAPYLLTTTEQSGLRNEMCHEIYFALIQDVQSEQQLRKELPELLDHSRWIQTKRFRPVS
jgi:hypothetical protein